MCVCVCMCVYVCECVCTCKGNWVGVFGYMLLIVRSMGLCFFLMRHNSSLVCKVGITYVHTLI